MKCHLHTHERQDNKVDVNFSQKILLTNISFLKSLMQLVLLFIAVYYKHLPRSPLVLFGEKGIDTKRKFRASDVRNEKVLWDQTMHRLIKIILPHPEEPR